MPPLQTNREKACRILFVDDEAILCSAVSKLLTRAGHHCECAADGAEALAKLGSSANRFDLILTDHRMPNVNGLALVERLRGAGFGGKIVVYSFSLGPRELAAYQALRVDAIIEKPATTDTIIQTIESFCGDPRKSD